MIRVLKQVWAAEFSSNPPPQSRRDYSRRGRATGRRVTLAGAAGIQEGGDPNQDDAAALGYETERRAREGEEADVKPQRSRSICLICPLTTQAEQRSATPASLRSPAWGR